MYRGIIIPFFIDKQESSHYNYRKKNSYTERMMILIGRKRNKSVYVILILLFVTLAAVCVTIWALFFRAPARVLSPDYAPVETEKYAEEIPNDTSQQAKSEEGGGSVSLTYSNQVSIDLSDAEAELMFANPGRSNQDMVLQIVIQETVIVQSGTLKPGHQVMVLDLLPDAAEKLSPGGYDGKFAIYYYSPDNGEKAIVNTEIPIKIDVTE